MGVLLALLLASDTILVVPFVPRGDAPPAAGIAVAEAIVDVVVQANRDNFLTLKQLDAVLRRRDLRLDDAAVAGRPRAHHLAARSPRGGGESMQGGAAGGSQTGSGARRSVGDARYPREVRAGAQAGATSPGAQIRALGGARRIVRGVEDPGHR